MLLGHRSSKVVLCFAIVALVVGAATSALAVPEKEILRINIQQDFTGACCFSWGETVSVTEPLKPTPVIVTFATDFLQDTIDNFTVGLMINGGPCLTNLGPTQIGNFAVDRRGLNAASMDWVILPTDGLRAGNNTFTLCGGGPRTTSRMTLGVNTLTATVSK